MSPLQEAQERHVANLELRTPQWRQIVRNAFSAGAVAAMTLLRAPNRQKYRGVSAFLRRLAFEGGNIVCTNALTAEQISEARDQGRMLVLADGVGFVIQPRGVASDAPTQPTNACKLTECQGKPRCKTCLVMDGTPGVAIPDGSRDALDPTRGEVKP